MNYIQNIWQFKKIISLRPDQVSSAVFLARTAKSKDKNDWKRLILWSVQILDEQGKVWNSSKKAGRLDGAPDISLNSGFRKLSFVLGAQN